MHTDLDHRGPALAAEHLEGVDRNISKASTASSRRIPSSDHADLRTSGLRPLDVPQELGRFGDGGQHSVGGDRP
nr:hypothetical protein [Micromonospora echinospora]